MKDVHVWRARLDRGSWPPASGLPEDERERAAAIRRPGARERWVAARWALRQVLARYLAVEDPADVELESGPHGKPALPPPAPLRFNLSHSGDLALVALSDEREVGIDVETVEPGRDLVALARIGLDESAAAAVREAPAERQTAAFYDAWVRREAIVKCSGAGLPGPLASTPVSLASLDAGPDHAAALAVAGTSPVSVRLFSLDGH